MVINFFSIKILYSSSPKFCFKKTISCPVSVLKFIFETSVMFLIFLKKSCSCVCILNFKFVILINSCFNCEEKGNGITGSNIFSLCSG